MPSIWWNLSRRRYSSFTWLGGNMGMDWCFRISLVSTSRIQHRSLAHAPPIRARIFYHPYRGQERVWLSPFHLMAIHEGCLDGWPLDEIARCIIWSSLAQLGRLSVWSTGGAVFSRVSRTHLNELHTDKTQLRGILSDPASHKPQSAWHWRLLQRRIQLSLAQLLLVSVIPICLCS